jgi:hypothetical protein
MTYGLQMAYNGFFSVWSFICYTEIEIIRQAESSNKYSSIQTIFLCAEAN